MFCNNAQRFRLLPISDKIKFNRFFLLLRNYYWWCGCKKREETIKIQWSVCQVIRCFSKVSSLLDWINGTCWKHVRLIKMHTQYRFYKHLIPSHFAWFQCERAHVCVYAWECMFMCLCVNLRRREKKQHWNSFAHSFSNVLLYRLNAFMFI